MARDPADAFSGCVFWGARSPASRMRAVLLLLLAPASSQLLPFLGRHALPALPQPFALIGIEVLEALAGTPETLLFIRWQAAETAIALADVGPLLRRHRLPTLEAFTNLLPLIR